MFNIDNEFKEYLNSDKKKYYLVRYPYTQNNHNYTRLIKNDQIVEKSLEITDSISDSKTLKFGIANKSSLSVQIHTEFMPVLGKKIQVYLAKEDLQEIRQEDENVKYITLGTFIIQNCSKSGSDLYTIAAYSESIIDKLSDFETWKYNQPFSQPSKVEQQLHITMQCSGGGLSTGTIGWFSEPIQESEFLQKDNETIWFDGIDYGFRIKYYELDLRWYGAIIGDSNSYIGVDLTERENTPGWENAISRYKYYCTMSGTTPSSRPFNPYVLHTIDRNHNHYSSKYVLDNNESFYPCGGAYPENYQYEKYLFRIPFLVEEVLYDEATYRETVINTYNIIGNNTIDNFISYNTINEITGSMIAYINKTTETEFDLREGEIYTPDKYYVSDKPFDIEQFVNAYYELNCAFGVLEVPSFRDSYINMIRLDDTRTPVYCNWKNIYPSQNLIIQVPSIHQNRIRSNGTADSELKDGFSKVYYEYESKDSNESMKHTNTLIINELTPNVYDLSGNFILNFYFFESYELKRHLNDFIVQISKVKFTRYNAECQNNMFFEPGDRVIIGGDNKEWFDTYIFKRIIKGDRVVWSLIS